jgi:hypothetical protein
MDMRSGTAEDAPSELSTEERRLWRLGTILRVDERCELRRPAGTRGVRGADTQRE